jgi:hypothetical protein
MNKIFLLVIISLITLMLADDDDGVEVEAESEILNKNDQSKSRNNNFDKQINEVLKPYINKLKEVLVYNLYSKN